MCLRKAGNGGASSPARAALLGHPLVVLVLRRGLGIEIASGTCLGSDDMLRSVLVPLRRSPRLGDTGRGGGFADVLQNGLNVHRFGDEGDDPHLGPAPRVGAGKRLVDARKQHHLEVAGRGPPDCLWRILRCGFHCPVGCRRGRHGLGRQSGDGWAPR